MMSGPVAQTKESQKFRGKEMVGEVSRHWCVGILKAEELVRGDLVSAKHHLSH